MFIVNFRNGGIRRMGIAELLMTAVALSMDAFAVAVCKGLATDKVRAKHMLITGAWFGGFQALMPLIGFLLGQTFKHLITPVDHWITFLLLGIIGFNMIKEALEGEEEADASLGFNIMLTMALATSIDALAVGIGFALIPDINIIFAVCSIGVITFALSMLGVRIGSIFGSRWRSPAELVGGLVLIFIGLKILIEHTLEDKSNYDLIIGASLSLVLATVFIFLAAVSLKKTPESCGEKKICRLYGAFGILASAVGTGLLITGFIIL